MLADLFSPRVATPMKFVAPVTEAERITLREARDQGPTAALRRRAQAVELSSRGYRLTAIAEVLEVHRETVSGWLDLWTTHGLRGLYDLPRSGRPPVLTPAEAEQVRAEVEQSPRQLRQVQARLQERLGKTASRQTLRRLLKKSRAGAGSAAGARSSVGAMRPNFGPSRIA
jgi:transposase